MGALYDYVQRHIDSQSYPPSGRDVAKAIGISPTALAGWRELKHLPAEKHLRSAARVFGVGYVELLTAALQDTYLHAEASTDELDLIGRLAPVLSAGEVERIVQRVMDERIQQGSQGRDSDQKEAHR